MLPGPILTETHRQIAIQRVADELQRRTAGMDRNSPGVWVDVARAIGIRAEAYPGSAAGSRGSLSYSNWLDCWIIQYNAGFSLQEQSEALVHEIAHWYLRQMEAQWLCNEQIVYHYEGPPDDERHEIARAIERRVLG